LKTATRKKKKYVAFKHLSIQQRLPLFICILLLTIIFAFGWVSYISVRNASVAIGAERVTTLADKLSLMFKESVHQFSASANTVATKKSVKEYLRYPNKADSLNTLQIFQKFLKTDTLNRMVQLLNANKNIVLSAPGNGMRLHVNIDSLKMPSANNAAYMSVGKFVLLNGSMYYPALATVVDKNKTIGYVVSWRALITTQKVIDQFGQLLGGNGRLYFGNDDQQFWTDLVKPVEKPPVDPSKLQQYAQYSRKGGDAVIASMRKIPDSRWLVLVELSGSSFLKTASLFLRWVIVIGVVLVIAGSFGGWLMSRNITKPLKELSRAASAIAEGDYSSPVEIDSDDELGKLAGSFNIMAARVQATQRELEKKVEERSRQLQTAITDINDQKESDRKKDEFISIASHELKTPLTTVKAFFQLAGREIHPQLKSFNIIGNASRQLNRMERLIEDLLDVSRINSGKLQYNFEDFDFQTVLKETIESVQEIFPGHKLILERSVSIIFKGDRHRIEQVMVNLLNNAVKYSPESDKVLISSELHGDKLLVTVKDFGVGIPKKHVNELFGRYYRIDGEYNFQGLGLGLFISSEILKRHGGSIWVKSEPGNGSAFTFQLPLQSA